MSWPLFGRTLAWQRTRWIIVSLAIFGWGVLIPVFYTAFSDIIRDLANSGAFPEELMSFGSGSLFSLPGAVTLGTQHPLAIAMLGVFAVGATSTAIAGERQRGTLEVLLARPLSRRTVYATILVAALVFVGLTLVAAAAGTLIGSAIGGVLGDLALDRLPIVWLNGMLMWGAVSAIGLAASVSFDRLTPAIGITLAIVIVSYFLYVLGSLWPDAKGLEPYSLFNYLDARDILTGSIDPVAFIVPGVVAAVAVAVGLVVFPRRDLAAPS